MNRFRILFWCDTFWPRIGGVEVLSVQFVRALQRRGHEIVVLTDRAGLELPPQAEWEGVPVHRLDYRVAFTRHELEAMLQLKAKITHLKRTFRPHLNHLFQSVAGFFYHLQTLAVHPTPSLLTVHGGTPSAQLADGTSLRRLMRQVDWLTACSHALREEIQQTVPEIEYKSSVIPNGLEFPTIEPEPLPLDSPRVLCVGRLVPEKGFDVAVEAFARIRHRLPKARLVMAGDGPSRSALEALVERLALQEAVEFLGWVPPAQVSALINTCTVLLVPSRYEAFSLVALQAAQLARPVIASRAGGLPEVVLDGITGRLVEIDDVDQLASVLLDLLEHPATAQAIGEAARRRAREQFDWQSYVDAYESLYVRLVEQADRATSVPTAFPS